MKKVILLGDSIRLMGYGAYVPGCLGEGYNVWQPEDNCRFASYMQRMLFDYREIIEGADVIHFNAGHWDLCRVNTDGGTFTPIDVYTREIERIGKLLLEVTPNVIFSVTTPVRPENPYNSNEDIEAFNNAAASVLKPLGVRINDLYTPLAKDIYGYILEDNIHLNEKASKLCASIVADAVKDILK
ncbi:MAG: SGNH/GDSL hydrolase family protein [Clostridia bacterium]|nr:SGNH/GDSL hydrolase family protein [Clostridia bacterium]